MNRAERLRRTAAKARRQRGAITRAQLRDLGWTNTAITRLRAAEVIQVIHPRVFSFGDAALTREGRWFAALLAAGPGAVLSHRSAALLWRLIRFEGRLPDVIVVRAGAVRIAGVRAHRCKLDEDDSVVVNGMRVTSPMRTLVDLADVVDPTTLADAVNQAMLRERFDRREFTRLVACAHGRHGVRNLRAVLATIGEEPEDVRSRAERRARDLLAAHGVGPVAMNAPIALGNGRYRYADLYEPQLRVDIEIDGPHHRLAHICRRDAIRDDELRAIGVVVDRYPDTILDDDPLAFVRGVAATLADVRRAMAA